MGFSLDHVHIYTADPEGAQAFYVRHFGAERMGALPTSHGGYNHFLLLGAQVIVISHFPPGLDPREPPAPGDGALKVGFGVAHIGINVPDLDATIASLKRAGVDPHASPKRAGPIRYVYLTGPAGEVVELTEYVLPAKLRPAAKLAGWVDAGIHQYRRLLVRQLLAR